VACFWRDVVDKALFSHVLRAALHHWRAFFCIAIGSATAEAGGWFFEKMRFGEIFRVFLPDPELTGVLQPLNYSARHWPVAVFAA
jgi:hypothetical protein